MYSQGNLGPTSLPVHYDNRDYDIFVNYQPRHELSFSDQTTLFGQEPGVCVYSTLRNDPLT